MDAVHQVVDNQHDNGGGDSVEDEKENFLPAGAQQSQRAHRLGKGFGENLQREAADRADDKEQQKTAGAVVGKTQQPHQPAAQKGERDKDGKDNQQDDDVAEDGGEQLFHGRASFWEKFVRPSIAQSGMFVYRLPLEAVGLLLWITAKRRRAFCVKIQ